VKDRLASIVEAISSVEFVDSHTFIVTNIVDALLKSCASLHDLNLNYLGNSEILAGVFAAKGSDSLLELLDRLVDEITKVNQQTRASGMKSSSDQLKDYLQLHYSEPDISLNTVASALSFSVSYISLLLKKQGTSFTKYVTELRMEKAKELLANPDAKIIVVANEVGYNDPFYFSHCFKKFYGTSPADYRKK
jgi:two-component system response regulator YesN